uniref:AAA family ATPase n=1 Tax=Microbacterium sp. TaxID=51671 RepID=UPI003734ECB1
MKLHRLELTGFGPFRQTQTVDFDAFDRDGLFLITGRTGAGKSSILDGVSFALYGSVPRYDGSEKRLRSDHSHLSDPTEVRLEFTVAGKRWRITRSPEYERPAQRGGGLTTEKARAELDELVDGVWIGRAAKLREVGQLLDEVLGLSAAQFQQVILLAQNKFSRFLLAPNNERQQLLRTLFGTRRFEEYKERLEQRRRDAQKALEGVSTQARTLLDVAERDVHTHGLAGDEDGERAPDDLPSRRSALDRALGRAEYRVEVTGNQRLAAAAAADAAAITYQDLSRAEKLLADLAAARTDLAAREAEQVAVDAIRARLDLARGAEGLRSAVDAAERAAVELAAADAAVTTAEEHWQLVGGSADDDLAAVIEQLTGDLARAQSALAREQAVQSLDSEITDRAAQIEGLETARAAIEVQLAEVPARRIVVSQELTAAREGAGRVEALTARREVLLAQKDAAERAVRQARASQDADARYAEASVASERAVATVKDLLHRRLRGYAGELAAALAPGEPCAVCGSTAHPAPAVADAEPVSDDDLAAAEEN